MPSLLCPAHPLPRLSPLWLPLSLFAVCTHPQNPRCHPQPVPAAPVILPFHSVAICTGSLVFTPEVLHSSSLTLSPGSSSLEASGKRGADRNVRLPLDTGGPAVSVFPASFCTQRAGQGSVPCGGTGGQALAPGPLQTLKHLQPQGAGGQGPWAHITHLGSGP